MEHPHELPDAVRDWVATQPSPVAAIKALASAYDVAIAYQTVESLTADVNRPLTSEEIERLAAEFPGYDEWLDNSGAAESMSYWRDLTLARAGIPVECSSCGSPMVITDGGAHHVIPGRDQLRFDYDADDDHAPAYESPMTAEGAL